MAKLITGTALGTTTVTFTTSQTWTCPGGVVTLLTVVGKGQDGTPATGGGYGPAVHHSVMVANIFGTADPAASPSPGTWSWSSSQSDIPSIKAQINTGGSGSYTSYNVTQYTNGYVRTSNVVSWTNAITNSAYTTLSAGWKTSGYVTLNDAGSFNVDWDELGTYSGGTAATTGSNTTGFSKTWNGGVGIPATSTTYYNVTVTPATGYPVVVPTGGYISITY